MKSPGVIFICHLILKPVSRGSVFAPTPYLWEGGMGISLFVREKQVEIHMQSCDTSRELFEKNSKQQETSDKLRRVLAAALKTATFDQK